MGPVVFEGVAKPVVLPFGFAEGVGDPARDPRAGVQPLQIDVETARHARAAVDGVDGDPGRARNIAGQFRREVVFGNPCGSLGLGFEPSDEQILEALPVTLHPKAGSPRKRLLKADDRVKRSFVGQVFDRIQVQEIVGGGQFFPPGALGVEAARSPKLEPAAEVPRGREPGGERGSAVQRAPVKPETRFQRQAIRKPEPVLNPRSAPEPRMLGCEQVRKRRSALDAAGVRLRFVSRAAHGLIERGLQSVEFESGLYEMGVPDLDPDFLAERQVADRSFPIERDRGEQIPFIGILHVHDAVLGEDLGLEVQELRVPVPRQDGRGGDPVRQQRIEAHGAEFVHHVSEEVHAPAVLFVLEREVRVLAARQAHD